MQKEWLTYRDLSERWSIAVQTLRIWVMERKLKPAKFGRLVRFSMAYILEIEARGGIR
jgi:hypothetical protein